MSRGFGRMQRAILAAYDSAVKPYAWTCPVGDLYTLVGAEWGAWCTAECRSPQQRAWAFGRPHSRHLVVPASFAAPFSRALHRLVVLGYLLAVDRDMQPTVWWEGHHIQHVWKVKR